MDKTGVRASNTAELVFEDCIVPAENLVGEAGDSMIHMMRNQRLNFNSCCYVTKDRRRSLDEMNKYAFDEAFGRQIRDFGQMQLHRRIMAKYCNARLSVIQQIILDLEKRVKD